MYYAIVIPIQRVSSTTPYVVVKVVSYIDGILWMGGIIQFQWGDLSLIQLLNDGCWNHDLPVDVSMDYREVSYNLQQIMCH